MNYEIRERHAHEIHKLKKRVYFHFSKVEQLPKVKIKIGMRIKTAKDIAYILLMRGVLLGGGVIIGGLLYQEKNRVWYLLASLLYGMMIMLGETIGQKIISESWYLTEIENMEEYHRQIAIPVKEAWLLLLSTTFICQIFHEVHLFFSCSVDIGKMLLLFYMLPFYPFNIFGGRWIRENDQRTYGVLVILSIITLLYTRYDFLLGIIYLFRGEL